MCKKRKFGELLPPHIKRFYFDVVEEKDGTIRIFNPQFERMNLFTVEMLVRGLANAVNEYNEEIKAKENK
mgnify:CR=1 FL=1